MENNGNNGKSLHAKQRQQQTANGTLCTCFFFWFSLICERLCLLSLLWFGRWLLLHTPTTATTTTKKRKNNNTHSNHSPHLHPFMLVVRLPCLAIC